MVHVPQDQVGRLPAHPGQLQQLLHGVRHPPSVVPQKHLGGQHDVLRLGPEKAGGVDVPLHLRDVRLRQRLQGRESGIEGRCHLVHPLIGALSRQTHREQQLIVLSVIQRADPIRVELLQPIDNAPDLFYGFHPVSHLSDRSAL